MKGSQKVTRVQLKVDQHTDHLLMGIVSAEPDYKLSLALNRKLGISLKNVTPLDPGDSQSPGNNYSMFTDSSEAPGTCYSLISNRNGGNFLIKKLRNIDYLFIAREDDIRSRTNEITAALKETEFVTAVLIIDINTIRDNNLKYLIQ
ncbi:MAG: IPExxxVDY family protein [Bacteroidales bacterium]|nr:IPExxxVDY family protein [Bacteroidales bacterium]